MCHPISSYFCNIIRLHSLAMKNKFSILRTSKSAMRADQMFCKEITNFGISVRQKSHKGAVQRGVEGFKRSDRG